jgi:uncharacterized SAM-binding protein YcdF (DUF218 family)
MALKKLIAACLLPYPIALSLLVLGLALLWFSAQRQRMGRVLASIGLLILLLGGYDVFSGPLLNPLERDYTPLSASSLAALSPAPVAIVVLGSGFRPNPEVPANDRLSANGLVRLTEGVRLARLVPDARLIVSDGLGQGEALAETATMMGVPRQRITLEARSNDTSDEAALLPPLIGGAPFLLVTSAAHMRRAMALCRKQGLHPIAAATDFAHSAAPWTIGELLPHASGFFRVEYALHEWIGLMWSSVRGTI